MNNSFYQYKAEQISGGELSMQEFQGQAVLIVNTASKCGFTPQYEGLEKLYKDYKDKGLVVLGFPCDQFGHQEPGTNEDIKSFCSLNYGVTFPMFKKIDVNGPDTHPLFIYLKEKLPGILGGKIKWNFTKFLIDTEGNPVKRFAPTTTPDKLVSHIESVLNQK